MGLVRRVLPPFIAGTVAVLTAELTLSLLLFARPGFLRALTAILAIQLASLAVQAPACDGIWAPALNDSALRECVDQLRAAGERVIEALPGQTTGADAHRCNRELVNGDSGWQVVTLDA